MTTPIFDFINEYQEKNPVRLHMPGHKGINTRLGVEHFDITEIEGADELYAAEGIIAQSEQNASRVFGCPTFYSTEGSSLSIRAMLFMLVKWCKKQGKKPFILAARNAHKTFINTVALLDIQVDWIMGRQQDSYEVCSISPKELQAKLDEMEQMPAAVYITSPDYLGNIADINGLSEVCHRNGLMLLVDNAHGAYLRYMNPSAHPMDLGADMCADSAHKTLPVLTGGAYLHVSNEADSFFIENAKLALEMFGSTSPSYLIMASLDLANEYMEGLNARLMEFGPLVEELKTQLRDLGYELSGDELLKITVNTREHSNGREIATKLIENDIYPEYIDDGHVVFMLTPQNTNSELERLALVMEDISKTVAMPHNADLIGKKNDKSVTKPTQVVSPHEAIYSAYEELPAEECVGRVLAATTVSCPPAVPVYMMGERIGEEVNEIGGLLRGRTLKVIKENCRCSTDQ